MGKRNSLHQLRLLLFIALLTVVASTASAQFNASLSGTVTDNTGAIIPGATVTLTNPATQAARTSTSGSQGTYQFSELPPGNYALTASAKGFQAYSLGSVTLIAETPRNVDIKLEVGEASQTVNVSADAVPVLNTSDASTSTSLSSADVTRLPAFGRDPYELLRLTAGVVSDAARSGSGSSVALPNSQGTGQSNSASSRRRTRSRRPAPVNVSPRIPSSSMASAWIAFLMAARRSSRRIPNPSRRSPQAPARSMPAMAAT